MKTIQISNAVYGSIWQKSLDHETSEDEILGRLLDVPEPASSNNPDSPGSLFDYGFYDRRFDVIFREGFSIFRTYKGTTYTARASGGRWHLSHLPNETFDSLNALNVAIGAKSENAWISWYYDDGSGYPSQIGDMRKEEKIKRKVTSG